MAVYRFRISFEDYDDIIREIDIKSNQTFLDLHHAIQQSTGYQSDKSSSFYVSTDQWLKGDEIAFMPSDRKVNNGIALMEKSKLSNFIDDPHQKFYYTYNFERPYDFHVELIRIMLDDDKGKVYPSLFRSVGEAPKLISGSAAIPAETAVSDDFDFLHEMEYSAEDAEDMESLDLPGDEAEKSEEAEEESDEFSDEFSDNDSFESESDQKDDY